MPCGKFWTALLPQNDENPYPIQGFNSAACNPNVQMSTRPVKLASIGKALEMAARFSLTTLPIPIKLSSTSGVSNTRARPQNDRIIVAHEVKISTAAHNTDALFPSVLIKNRSVKATAVPPASHEPARMT